MHFESINHCKSVFAHNFLIEPADKNYFIARWAIINGFYEEFFWQASQAIEKYLKAGLVLNDIPAIEYGHNLSKLLDKHISVFDKLSLDKLTKPELLADEYWVDEKIDRYISRIQKYGHVNSRYGMISWFQFGGDVFKLDQMVFNLRRLTIGLDWIVGDDWKVEGLLNSYIGQKYQKTLNEEPLLQIRPWAAIRDTSTSVVGPRLNDTMFAWNFSLCRNNNDIEKPAPDTIFSLIGSMRNSYIYSLKESLASKDAKENTNLVGGVHWLVKNIALQKDLKKMFEELLIKSNR